MTLEELVLQYQSGDIATFDMIYHLTEKERESSTRWLRTALPSTISMPEIYAMYDDALLSATVTFKQEYNCTFTTHLRNLLDNSRKSELERVNAKKRGKDVVTVSFQQEPDDGQNLSEVIADDSATTAMESIEGTDILNLMNGYSALSAKKKENALLIIQDTMYFETAKEKYDRMRHLLQTEITDTALRKKCQRAKADFRQFVEEIKYK